VGERLANGEELNGFSSLQFAAKTGAFKVRLMISSLSPGRVLEADVVVVGLGPAGSLAALAAARQGVRVIGIEKDFALGGTGTRGGVHSYYYGAHGGMQEEIDARVKDVENILGARGGSFHPEAKRAVLTDLLSEEGVRVLFSCILCEAEVKDGTIRSLVVCDQGGPMVVRGRVFIDSSGDGDLAAAAGALHSFGRGFDGASHSYSFVPRNILQRVKGGRWEVSFDNYDAGWVDPRDPWDFSRAVIEGRQQMQDYFSEEPGRTVEVIGTSSQLGVREGRHVVGDHVMSFSDFLEGRSYPDVICTASSHYDNHTRDLANEPLFCQMWLTALAMYRKGVDCQIPYRSILAKGLNNLLVACRALSVDREVSMAVRMQRDMQKLGEAAGTAAALAVKAGVSLREIDLPRLQEMLVGSGVIQRSDLSTDGVPTYNFTRGPLEGQRLVCARVLADAEERRRVRKLLPQYLGTPDEGKAMFWLRLLREEPRDDLLALLSSPDYRQRRSAAFALAFMGDVSAEPVLMECLRKRDPECPPPDIKTYPRWVAALIFFRALALPSAFEEALQILREGTDDRYLSFVLAYFCEILDALDSGQRERLLEAVKTMQGEPRVGRQYLGQGGSGKKLDIRWNIDLWTARLYRELSPADLEELSLRYAADPRPFVRAAWKRFLSGVAAPVLSPTN
jgi:Dehydrogenases (flavoproteins)